MVSATTVEENGKFCIAVGPVTRTVDILAYFMIALSRLSLADSKVKGDELPHDGPHGLCVCHLFHLLV